jgi:copper chaperone
MLERSSMSPWLTFPEGEAGDWAHEGPVRRAEMKLKVSGMTCGHCERAVQKAVAALGGTATVDLAAGTVEVAGVEDTGAVRRAIEKEGYVVEREGLEPSTPAL